MNLYPFVPLAGPLGDLKISGSLSRVVGDPFSLDWQFKLEGDSATLLFPVTSGERKKGLWEHTCFELFLRSPLESGYLEINYAPGGAWNAFRFDCYREGMREDSDMLPFTADFQKTEGALSCSIRISKTGSPWSRHLSAGLTCVLENRKNELSYWALVHVKARPDFHASESFIYRF